MKNIFNTVLLVSVGSFIFLGSLVFLPGVGSASVLNESILGQKSETKNLLLKFEPLGYTEIKGPGEVVFNVISLLLGFLGIASVFVMMYGGFLWLTAGGEENKAKQGSTLLFQAFIGLVIILSAYMVTYFVLANLTAAVTSTL